MEDWKLETVPQLAAGKLHRRWLQRGFSGQCLKTEQCLSCSASTSQRVTPVVDVLGSVWTRTGIKQHGVPDFTDTEARGLGFSYRRMVLRPRPKHIRQRFTSVHLAVSAMFPLHALHGEWDFFVDPLLVYLRVDVAVTVNSSWRLAEEHGRSRSIHWSGDNVVSVPLNSQK